MRASLLVFLLLTAQAQAADWPQFKGGPERTGRGPGLRLPVEVAWRAEVKGASYSSPAIAGDRVVLGASSRRVYAFDLYNGAKIWEQAMPSRIWGSAPAVDKGRVYIGSVDGCMHALDLAAGNRVESLCAPPARGFGRKNDVLSPPLAALGKIFFGADDYSLYAWAPGQAAPQWAYATQGIIHDNGAALCNGLVLIASRDRKLYAMDPATGKPRWTFEGMDAFNTVPACDKGVVYVGNGDGYVYALDADTGKKRWSHALGKGVMSSPALDGAGYLYVGAADHKVYCLDIASGLARWAFQTGDMVLASPLVTGGLVWIGSYDGKLYALDRERGLERWSLPLKGGVFTAPAVSGDRIVVTGRDGEVVCLRATPDPSYHP